MASEIRLHRFLNGRDEGSFSEAGKESKAFQLVFDRILHLGKVQFDSLLAGNRTGCGVNE